MFKGRSLEGLKSHERVLLGMSRTFQNIRLFSQMTVLENVMVGRHCRTHAGLLRMFFRLGPLREEREIRARAEEILALHRARPSARRRRRRPSRSASSAASRSRARSPPIRICCCSTSRRRE